MVGNCDLMLAASELGYGPIVVLVIFTTIVSTVIMLLTHLIPKAKRTGDRKDATYESGMPIVGDARRRFNVRFYLVAMLFLLFDVELIFLYPWAVNFMSARSAGDLPLLNFLFVEMAIFFGLLLVGLIYDLGKGVLEFD